jgi:hypothetical protein
MTEYNLTDSLIVGLLPNHSNNLIKVFVCFRFFTGMLQHNLGNFELVSKHSVESFLPILFFLLNQQEEKNLK